MGTGGDFSDLPANAKISQPLQPCFNIIIFNLHMGYVLSDPTIKKSCRESTPCFDHSIRPVNCSEAFGKLKILKGNLNIISGSLM